MHKLLGCLFKLTMMSWPYRLLLVCTSVIVLFLVHPKLFNLRLFWDYKAPPLVAMKYVVNFYLWTRHNIEQPEEVIVGSTDFILKTSFTPCMTYVIVHGFTGTGLDPWILSLKNALLSREKCNVISVNWMSGSVTAGYFVIQERVPEVGEDILRLLQFLKRETGLKEDLVHIIGHSLGAHIAGLTGQHLNGTLRRISGLDPAGLMFYGVSPDHRLDKTDALFVDVIHTHACYTLINQWTDCYGNYERLGHADFWPNGGEQQPACHEGGNGDEFVKEGSNCHHGIVYAYYIESIQYGKSNRKFLAKECESWDHFLNESCTCGSSPQYMGHNANSRAHGMFYLNTSRTYPFGLPDYTCPAGEYSWIHIAGLLLLLFLPLCTLLMIKKAHSTEEPNLHSLLMLWPTNLFLKKSPDCKK